MRGEKGGDGGGDSFSEPVSQYRCMNLPKTDDNDRIHKNDLNSLS